MRGQFDRLVFVSRFRFTRDQGVQASVEDATLKDAPAR
jgi:protein TonB